MRLAPLTDGEWDDRARSAVAGFLPRRLRDARGAGNAVGTMLRHPDLAEAYLGFNVYLLTRSSLSPRLRELVILRVARRRGCEYEWVHHVKLGADTGLTPAEIEDAGQGKSSDPLESAALAAVDELDGDSNLSDGTWAALSEHLDERQRMDLVFTIGAYCLLAMAFNTFGVEPETVQPE
jgi:AhpD family alkylhydroperoxidase